MRKTAITCGALAATALIASVPALAATSMTSTKTYSTSLSGKNEVTPKSNSKGSGTAKITLNASKGQVCYSETWKGIDTPTMSHIHKGKAGVAGPIVVALYTTKASHSGCVKASKTLITAIEKSPSGYYVNIHTKKYPAGAIRGQL